jgi:hypothetical protein
MCILNTEENKMIGTEGEVCSILRIMGKEYKCNEVTVKACAEAEEALANQEENKETIFSNKGAINERCFLPFKLDYGSPLVAGKPQY